MNYSLTENSKQKTYYGIDLIKFICSLLVVTIHVPALLSFNKWLNYGVQNYLARLAVPFFFTASGFFLFRKTEPDRFSLDPSFRFAKKILRLYGTWIALLFVGGAEHLWYLVAVVVAVLLVSFLLYIKMPKKYILLLSAVLYVIGLLGGSYRGLAAPLDKIRPLHILFTVYSEFFKTTKNGVFMGMLFVSIGMLFAYVPIKMKKRYAVGGFVLSMLFLLGEVAALEWFGLSYGHNMFVFLVPAVFFLFYIASHLQLKPRKIYGTLRIVSILTYYSHMFVYYFVSHTLTFALNAGLPKALDNSLVRYGATVVLTIALSLLIYRLSQKKHLHWLKWLYS